MSACGTKLPKPMRQACPVLAKADLRPAYRADVSLARAVAAMPEQPRQTWLTHHAAARMPSRARSLSWRD
jgi:hypothetical protein